MEENKPLLGHVNLPSNKQHTLSSQTLLPWG